jgi:nicotinate-nucleotide adenylyltransferase
MAGGWIVKLGVLGGTFDPIHLGHLLIAEQARDELGLERVLFVPAGYPPHKPDQVISPDRHRLAMLSLAIASHPAFVLSRVDVDRPGPSYTADTLSLLQAEWGPAARLHFILGSDSLAELLTWHQPRCLIQQARLAVADRPGIEVDLTELEKRLPGLQAVVDWMSMPEVGISATDIQRRVRRGRSIRYQVPAAVEAYIYEHGLYRCPTDG